VSCGKYLDQLPDPTLTIPNRLEDLQALLDNYGLNSKYSASPTILADEYYLSSADFNALTNAVQRDLYLWRPNGENTGDWNNVYTQVIVVANTILDYAKQMDSEADKVTLDDIKGRAYFLRGFYYALLAQLFAPPYDPLDAQPNQGIPLR